MVALFHGVYGLKSTSNPIDAGTTLASKLLASRLETSVVILSRGELD
jgi:hypothetical protein